MIVIYKENIYKDIKLKPNKQYLVNQIIDNKILIFGYNKYLNTDLFTNEDGSDIIIKKYTNPYVLTKKSVKNCDKVICIQNFGDNRFTIGEVYDVEKVEYYGKYNFKLDLKIRNSYTYWNEYFEPNMFLKYSPKILTYIKMLHIFNDIKIYNGTN